MASIIIKATMSTPQQKECVKYLESYALEFGIGFHDVVRLALIQFTNREFELCEIKETEIFIPNNKKK